MSTQETADVRGRDGSDETDRQSRPKRVLSAVTGSARSGTAAALAGGILLADALRRAGQARRGVKARALVGGALLGAGLRRRRSSALAAGADDGPGKTSSEAHSHRVGGNSLNTDRTSPRGIDGEPEVETETDPDEGDVRFTTDRDAESNTRLEDSDVEDSRLADEDPSDDGEEISLSKTKMTDELGKVADPEDEQAYPALEGTDPEPMSEKAPPRYGQGSVANPDSDDGVDDHDADDDEESA